MFNPSNNDEMFEIAVAVCVMCVSVYFLQKEGEWGGKIFGYKKYIESFKAMLDCSCKCS